MRYFNRLLEREVKSEIKTVSAGSRWPIRWRYVDDRRQGQEQQVLASIEDNETLRLVVIAGGVETR